MSSLIISDEMAERLQKRAAALNTVEKLIAQLLLNLAPDSGNPTPVPSQTESFEEWKKKFDAWMADVEARAHRYPPGFVMDDSRESMYEGCGE